MNGCIVIHGLTGTPATVSPLSDALLAAGFRVQAPCLAGHGGTLEDLRLSTWEEWYDTVRKAYANLRRDTQRVFFAGMSLGALLGLKLALDEGFGVSALALIGTPLRLPNFQRALVPIVRYTPLKWVVKNISKDFEKSVDDPVGCEKYRRFSLPKIPARSVFELVDLQNTLIPRLKDIVHPIMLLHGRNDLVAPISNVYLVEKLVSSEVVEKVTFTRSKHVLSMDWEREVVARTVVDFFRRFV